jgi:hypothetical protein
LFYHKKKYKWFIDIYAITFYNNQMLKGFAGFALKFIFCIIAALLQVGLPVLFLGITPNPLIYLDTVFIITITLLWGFKWGLISAAVSSILVPTLSIGLLGGIWQQYLFIPCFFATAFVTYLFMHLFPAELNLAGASSYLPSNQSRRKSSSFDRLMSAMIALILLAFALCVIISILGGCISTLIILWDNSMAASGNITPEATVPQLVPNMPLLAREILSRIPINIIDRLVSVFLGYGTARSIAVLISLTRKKFSHE